MLNLNITENAKNHFSKLLKSNQSIYLGVKDSGCSGFSYVLDVKDNSNFDPVVYNQIPFIINSKDFAFLQGCTIDFKKDGLNQSVVFLNPNVENECGCGKSFSIK